MGEMFSDMQLSTTEYAIHGAGVLFFGVCALYTFSPFSLFPYHPALMCLGYGVLMGEGILFSRYIKSRNRKWWLQVHLFLQLAGYLCVAVAFAAIVYNKIARGKDHFQSWHALIGLFAFIVTTLQIAVGLVIYYLRKSLIKMGGVPFAIQVSRAHGWSGVISHALSMTALAFGFRSNYSIATFGASLSNIFLTLTTIITFFVLVVKPTKTKSSKTTAKAPKDIVSVSPKAVTTESV